MCPSCMQGGEARPGLAARVRAAAAGGAGALVVVDNAEDALAGPEPEGLLGLMRLVRTLVGVCRPGRCLCMWTLQQL